jgi:hypothetical protein
VEITEGLQAGQSIVSDDVDGLTSGMAARPKTAGDSVDSSSGTGGKHKKGAAK